MVRYRFVKYRLVTYTHLDLWDTDIPIFFMSKTSWRCFQSMFSGRLQDMSSRRLQDVFNVFNTSCGMSSRSLGRRKIVTLKTYWRRLQDVLNTNKCLLGQWLIKIKLRNIQLMQHVRMCHTHCFDSDPASKRMEFQLSLNRTFCPTPALAITNFLPKSTND